MLLGKKLRSLGEGLVGFHCPGCKTGHMVIVARDPDLPDTPCWGYNGNPDAPTFTPSILCRGTVPITNEQHARIMAGESFEPQPLVCHSFVTDGRIRYLEDSTHSLAGQTVELPDWENL